MRCSPVSAAILLLFVASPVFAQDAAGPWTGFYAGLNAGYAFGDTNASTTGQAAVNNNTVADGARPAYTRLNKDGFIGGGQLGFNWQDSGSAIVYGVELDLQDADVRDVRNNVTVGTAFPGTRNNLFREELEWFGTARGRIGYDLNGILLYGTGGLAYGGVNNSANFSGPLPAAVPQFQGGINNTKYGWTVGGGLEYALDTNWSVKTEYLYYDLGSNSVPVGVIPGSGGAGTGYNVNFNNYGHIARVGLNYKF